MGSGEETGMGGELVAFTSFSSFPKVAAKWHFERWEVLIVLLNDLVSEEKNNW